MKKLFTLLAVYLLLLGCSNQREDQTLYELKEIVKNEIHNSLIDFERRYASNPAKSEKAFYIAFGLKNNFKLVYSQMESGNVNKDSIQKYLQIGLSYYGDEYIETNASLKNRVELINKLLNSRKIPKQRLEYLIYDIENVLLSKTYQDIDKDSYKFNLLRAIAVTEKTEIKLGETFQARIYLSAFDTTLMPRVTFRDSILPIEDGYGVLQIKATSRGIKEYHGNIEWDNGEFKPIYLPYTIIYTVK